MFRRCDVGLAFSVAAFIKTDILIVDEALSVCDDKFCGKALEKMRSMKEKGTAVLFVSYSGSRLSALARERFGLKTAGVR